MLRSAAAVMTAAAVAGSFGGVAASADVDRPVRAEIAVADQRHVFDIRRIRIVDGLSPGESYRLPAFAVRNHRESRTAYRLFVSTGAAQWERRPPRRWLHVLPAVVGIDAGRSRAVGVRLELPDDAAPGVYAAALGVRPGGPEGARLTFRVVAAGSTRPRLRLAWGLASWLALALVGAALVGYASLGNGR